MSVLIKTTAAKTTTKRDKICEEIIPVYKQAAALGHFLDNFALT